MCLQVSQGQSVISHDFGSRTTPWTSSPPDTYDIPMFDSALGTLTGATFTFYEGYDVQVDVQNPTANPGAAAFTIYGDFDWESTTLGNLSNTIRDARRPDNMLILSTGGIFLSAGENFSQTYSTSREYQVDLDGMLALLSGIGVNTFDLNFNDHIEVERKAVSTGFTYSSSEQSYIHGQITYTYTPVPEPSGALLTVAGGLLAAMRRSRKS